MANHTEAVTTPGAALTSEEIAEARARLGIPPEPEVQRSWIRYQLQLRQRPETGRKWTQADVARECFITEPMVSRILAGKHLTGRTSDRVRRLVAEIIGVPEAVLFPRPHGETDEQRAEEAEAP